MTALATNPDHIGPAIIGTGRMATEYVKALRYLGFVPSIVVGRDPARAKDFAASNAVPAVGGGCTSVSAEQIGSAAIVAVSHDELAPVALDLISKGVGPILLEKPGALDQVSLTQVADAAAAAGSEIYVAYNRRFYPWVHTLTEAIEADGGLQSCHMEFTEWERAVLAEGVSDRALERWGIVNSTHILDLGFLFAGEPSELNAIVSGALPWHPAGSIFAGAGRTDQGVVFTYSSNWCSAGRWRIEFTTGGRRFVLAPLEKPQVQNRYDIDLSDFDFPAEASERSVIKTGFVEQLEAFLTAASGAKRDPRLFTVAQQLTRWPCYSRIFGYGD